MKKWNNAVLISMVEVNFPVFVGIQLLLYQALHLPIDGCHM